MLDQRAEIDGLDERSPVIPIVTSTRDNCLGQECPVYKDCFVMAARREAMAADPRVVVMPVSIVSVFLGDDTRYWYAYTQEAELNGTASEIRPYLDEVLHERGFDALETAHLRAAGVIA